MKVLGKAKAWGNLAGFVWLGLAVLALQKASPADAQTLAPDWFERTNSYEIFSAWKNLSTIKASICVSASWFVLGGIVCDKNGNPLPSTPVNIMSGMSQRGQTIGL